ncbi:hypothetical protein CSAL01_11686 [Colletotrichum salicis]|uniref:Uncharacterized protein n=1 Tax=Colletotrichum salicis TaxID=1209931 RepID=A0A135S344_9PEZI|nr:hypothetical protein CSAL01_11686 [Colletotrichum salicis]
MCALSLQSFVAMMNELTTTRKSLETHLEFHNGLKLKIWPTSNDYRMQTLCAKAYTEMGLPMPAAMQPHRIMKYSPVMAGLYLFRIRVQVYTYSFAVANAWGSIMTAAHLYNAPACGGLDGGSVARHGEVLPPDGFSAATFATNRWPNVPVTSRSGPRGIKEGAPVSWAMTDAKVFSSADVDWTPELLDDINGGPEIDFGSSTAKARAGGTDENMTGGGLAPEDLTLSLVLALHAESLEMAFPWLLMHRGCWRFLRAVKDHCDPLLRELCTHASLTKEANLPSVVGFILKAAAKGVDGGLQDKTLLTSAAEVYNGSLSTEAGKKVLEVARGFGLIIDYEFAASTSITTSI